MAHTFAELDEGTAGGAQFRAAEHDGELLLFRCHKLADGVKTTYGEKTAIDCDVVVLDGPAEGTEYTDARVFNTVLVSQLTSAAKSGKPAVGRLGTGQAGQSGRAPWKLAGASEDERAQAEKYLRAQSRSDSAGAGDDPPF